VVLGVVPPGTDGPGDGHDVDAAVVAVGLPGRVPLDERKSARITLQQGAERVGEVGGDGEVGRAAEAVVVDEAGRGGTGGMGFPSRKSNR
jgi:hypothetical protein